MLETSILTLTMLGVMMIASWAFCLDGRLSGYSVTKEIVSQNNPAVGIRLGLFLLAFVLSFWQVIHPSGISMQEDLNLLVKYSLVLTALLIVSRRMNDYLILSAFDNNKEVVGEQNSAVAVVEGATYLASAMIFSGALAEFHSRPVTALLWCAAGQAFLILLYKMYRFVQSGVDNALDNHNLAAAFSVGGFLLAGGIMLGAAINGPSLGFLQDVIDVSLYVAVWLGFMVVAYVLTDLLLVPGAKISDEVYKDKNSAVGVLNATVAIALTLFYTLVH